MFNKRACGRLRAIDRSITFSQGAVMTSARILAAASVLILVCAFVYAEEKAAAPAKAPTQEEMMAMMAKYSTPGPEHEKLKAMEGEFDAEVSMQMAPDAPPMTSKGKMKN